MAKFERTITGDFDDVLDRLHRRGPDGSFSASYEDGSDYAAGDVRLRRPGLRAVQLVRRQPGEHEFDAGGPGRELFLSAITSGGSQAVLFKINTWGEEAFLDTLRAVADGL